MNLQQVGQPKSFNGYGRRKSEREGAFMSENKIQSGKSNASRLAMTGIKGDNHESPSCDRLLYIATCLIGQQVEVHVKSGSIYSGIFHAANADKDFGIILKMARLMKDSSIRGKRSAVEFLSQAPSKTLIISGKDLVQIMAKDVAVTRDELCSEAHHELHQEIMVDSAISQSRHVEMERELLPWVPDGDHSQCPELENIFDGPWNRRWDQFEINEALFGVKSTFNEELYTTKLEKGPHMRELEKQALRIAREIEGEETRDLHLAEERGINLHEDFDIDEETRFSSVYRDKGVDDSGHDEREDIQIDSRNSETFGGTFTPVVKKSSDLASGEGNGGAQLSSDSSVMDLPHSSQSNIGMDVSHSSTYDPAKELASELPTKSSTSLDGERVQDSIVDQHGANDSSKEENQAEDGQPSKSEDSQSLLNLKKDGSDKGELNASSFAPSAHVLLSTQEKAGSPGDMVESSASGKVNGDTKSENSHGRPGSSASSAAEPVGGLTASSRPGLSPSSSVGSLSSERSTLNPDAKEFKLNPNARSFIPSQTSRPPSPASDASFYFPTNVTSVPHMPTMPVGVGMGPTFTGPQQAIYNPQLTQVPLTYFHPNGPQYGQLVGHPRQVMYMPPGYIPETQYRGREY